MFVFVQLIQLATLEDSDDPSSEVQAAIVRCLNHPRTRRHPPGTAYLRRDPIEDLWPLLCHLCYPEFIAEPFCDLQKVTEASAAVRGA